MEAHPLFFCMYTYTIYVSHLLITKFYNNRLQFIMASNKYIAYILIDRLGNL